MPKVYYSRDLNKAAICSNVVEERALPEWAGFRLVEQFTPSPDFPKRFFNVDSREDRTVYSADQEAQLARGWLPVGGQFASEGVK